MNTLRQVIDKLGELLLEAEALLVSIRVTEYDAFLEMRWQAVAMSAVGLLIGAVIGCAMTFHILGGVR